MNSIHRKSDRKEKEYAIGVDFGGTKIGIALVGDNGDIIHFLKLPTQPDGGKDNIIFRIKYHIQQMIEQTEVPIHSIIGIGIGIPGPVNPQTGMIYSVTNLPGWKEVPIKQIMEKEFHISVVVENDANAAAWGEKTFGIAQDIHDMICLTLGTGIGGGLIFDGKIYHGKNFYAGEIGHIIVDKNGPACSCGGFGCLEAYSSAKGIKGRIYNRLKKLKKNDNNFSSDIVLENICLAEVFKQARQGNPLFEDIVHAALEYLGIGITTLVNLLNPEMVVLVGGITNEGDKLLKPVKDIVFQRAMKSSLKDLKIVFGQLGEYAGVIGSAALLWKID